MIEFLEWVLATLGIVTLTFILAERYGIEIAVALFASLTVLANIIAYKIVTVGSVAGFALIGPAGVIVYASTFLITDLISEMYGREQAKKAVIAGLAANIVALVSIHIAVNWTPAPFMTPESLRAFNEVLSFAPRLVVASVIAYTISQTHDVYAFHFWKKITGGKYLWLRNNASTTVSQAIDTVIFISIAFYGVVSIDALLSMIVGQYLLKVAIAALDTPFIYVATYAWKIIKPAKVGQN
jgi:hypothetical protein